MTYPYAPPPSGTTSPNYVGSYQEYINEVANDLAGAYSQGTLDMSVFTTGTGGIGQPNVNDFGNMTQTNQTYNFWQNYATAMAAAGDPGLVNMFGAAPTQQATFIQDPNSTSAITTQQGANSLAVANANNAASAAENAANNASSAQISAAQNAANLQAQAMQSQSQLQSAQIQAAASQANAATQASATLGAATIGANAQIQSTGMQTASNETIARWNIQSDWAIAVLNDATQRWVAEGNWGVQKYVAQLQETGLNHRLGLELGFRREELAQRGLEEKNRHGEQMVSLALEVAKYDSELAASPRNWLKYAAWLRGRNVVINGLSLAMASQEVPDDAIDPAQVAEVSGSNFAAVQVAQELVSGASGGSTSTQDAFGAQTAAMTGAGADPAAFQFTPPPSPDELGSTTNYSDLARKLIGMNPAGSDPTDASAENLQAVSNQLRTGGGQQIAPYQAWGGPTTNALGVNLGEEVSGQGVDYRKFVNQLAPSEQQMKLGEVESVRGSAGVADWLSEMDRSRPKGTATFAGGGYG
ncbi:MAG: hypothetical protein H0U59_10910 [Gemmatimonadaceae bacterium]|nr:hypothetical protein [Gemmatimonadaceae bacterium]